MPLTPCYIPDAAQSAAVRPPVAGWFARTYGATSGYFGWKCPAVGPNVDWTLPTADGSNGQFLQTNGSGSLSWGTVSVSGYLVKAPASQAANTVQPTGTTVVPFTIKNISSQTGNATQWQDSTGAVQAKVDASGNFTVGTMLTIGIGGSAQTLQFTGTGSHVIVPGNQNSRIYIGSFDGTAGQLVSYGASNSQGASAGIWQLNGVQNSATGAANTCSLNGSYSSGANVAGGDVKYNGGQGTGTAGGGSHKFSVALPGSAGSVSNALTTVLTIDGASGNLVHADGFHIQTGTTTGTKFGTVGGTSGQKLGFFGATPIVQPLLATGVSHTVDDVISTLQSLGLCRQT